MWLVKGQGRVLALFKRSLAESKLSHAYLLVGPPQVGKGTLALNLAQALNCTGEEPPCQQCSSCLKIARNNFADVRILNLESAAVEKGKARTEISIDDIREIQHDANLPPFEGKHKVFIIDGAERLSTEASNCLLKILEEPPEKVVFVLLSAEESRLLPTVTSRCQRLELRPMPANEICRVLVESYEVAPPKAELLARLSQGRLGRALAVRDGKLEKERSQVMEELIALPGATWEERFRQAAKLAGVFEKERRLGEKILEIWIDWWRDLMLFKTGNNDTVVNIDYLSALKATADSLSLAEICDFILKIGQILVQIRQNVNPRLACETLMLDMPRVAETGVSKNV